MKKSISMLVCMLYLATGLSHAAQPKPQKWTELRNIEFAEYCLALPLEGYAEDFKQSDVKGKHVLTNRARKKSEIVVWGLDNAYSKAAPEIYFKRYYGGAEEQGQILEERKLDAAAKRFYGWGYWSNSRHETRFLEIVWLRDKEVVKFQATFPVADMNLWKARLPHLLAQTTACK